MPATVEPARRAPWDYAKLVAWRKDAGLRREKVATDLDISLAWLAQIEQGNTGTRSPSLAILVRLADYYGHHVTELVVPLCRGGPG